eukprot:12921815-Ditylum_brightwellii.AAC.1
MMKNRSGSAMPYMKEKYSTWIVKETVQGGDSLLNTFIKKWSSQNSGPMDILHCFLSHVRKSAHNNYFSVCNVWWDCLLLVQFPFKVCVVNIIPWNWNDCVFDNGLNSCRDVAHHSHGDIMGAALENCGGGEEEEEAAMGMHLLLMEHCS